VDNWQCEKMDA